jgi:hypothetical protein
VEAAVAALENLGFVAATVGADGKPIAAADRAGMTVTTQDIPVNTLRPLGTTITLTVAKI